MCGYLYNYPYLKDMPGQKYNCIGMYRDEKVHIWGGIGIVVCHCHPKYELFSPEISVVALCQAKNKNSLHGTAQNTPYDSTIQIVQYTL